MAGAGRYLESEAKRNERISNQTETQCDEQNKLAAHVPSNSPHVVSYKRLTEPRYERKCVITAQITMLTLPYASRVPLGDNCRELATIDG